MSPPAPGHDLAGRRAAMRPRAQLQGEAGDLAMLERLLHLDRRRRQAMVSAVVVAETARCVECGICTFNCPIGIDVRAHVRQQLPIADQHCLTCGDCVARCPRGTLRFEASSIFEPDPARGGR